MRSNTTITVFMGAILPDACPACSTTQTTFPNKWQIRTAQQPHGKFVGSDYTTEFDKENDDLLKENFMTVYVKTIYRNTISLKCERNTTAAVISDEVERRSSIPRDMTYLVHKGKMMSEKKTIKENNIEAEATIEMSLRLLGGMETNEQMDTHETEEGREKKRKLEEGKEGKTTKPNDEWKHSKDQMKQWIATQERPMKKWKGTQEILTKKQKATQKKTDERMDDFSRKADELLEKFMLVTKHSWEPDPRDELIHRENARSE